jgi:DNA polymerase III gamma/tau subunit
MKKIFFITIFLMFLGGVGSILFLAPNELHFKILNTEGNFLEAKKVFAKWSIIAKNNALGTQYQEEKYKQLQKDISSLSQGECNHSKKHISEFCRNIFYLEGLIHYQLGKEKSREQQKPFFEQAISSFQKVMAMSEEHSQEYTWAKENIDFLHMKFQETQEKEQQNEKNQSGQENLKKENNQQESSQNAQNKHKQTGSQKEDSSEEQNNNKEKNTPQQSSSDSNKREEEKETGGNSEQEESRLPERMKKELEITQKQLEENQKDFQHGFHRSQSAAEQKKYDKQNVFYDPFFQDFFGNDPFFQNMHQPYKLQKELSDPHEKDW